MQNAKMHHVTIKDTKAIQNARDVMQEKEELL